MEHKVIQFGKRLWKDETGPTAIEYGLIAAGIAVAIIAAIALVGDSLKNMFNDVANNM